MKFNSQKICELAYARIQGTQALINHFHNSNVMNSRVLCVFIVQDRRIRPYIMGNYHNGSNDSNNPDSFQTGN